LEDQGGELLSLRYDLTVPFARFMGLNNVQKMKRFHIGKVYRRDQPNMNRGRFREFYQCDFDIAGKTDPMLAEAEILKIAVEILAGFDLKFKLKISHRLLLEAIIEVAGCDLKKFRTICSSIDKLDKEPWHVVEKELQAEKGLTPEQTSILERIVLHKGSIPEILKLAAEKKLFGSNEKAVKSLEELRILNDYVQIFGISDFVDLDFSLARGLDYYTGVIYEGVLTDEATGAGLGSIAGGGRYDELIGMFSKDRIPAIGISIGIERLFTILEKKYKDESRASEAEFLVATIGKKGTLEKKLELASRLWAGDIKAEILYDLNPKVDRQIKHALEKKIPFVLWVGEEEVVKKAYKIKILYRKEEIPVAEEDLIEVARKLSAQYQEDLKKGTVVFQE
jgi:histidyl-tRNA synthetase